MRGPHSRAKLLADGLDCPEVYGDPALLYPLFYNPVVEPRFDLGIVQHFREAGLEPLPEIPAGMAVRIIDITGGINDVVDAILSCRHVASSSLHGLIAAHAYGIPATWLRFSDRLLGDGFKFRDYWASLGWDDAVPVEVAAGTPCEALLGTPRPLRPRVDLKRLLQACPFIDEERQAELCALIETRSGLAGLVARSG